MAEAFTIADAARRCGVTRRTLQRAIQHGRLRLTPDHRLTGDALSQAGYTVTTGPQERGTAPTPLQEVSQRLTQVIERLDRLITLLEAQQDAGTPQRRDTETPQRQTSRIRSDTTAPHRSDDAATAPAFDPTRFVLGRLCKRGTSTVRRA